ncbi:NADP-dependent oxidoreductase domain-containing protein [Tuber borchii]|uniref:NADP-dependent oxidoreductase domain-containing protein n=1 Tax=Tuber borchii TaxID=42251 RepID=A0A2T6ZWN6_TUBBO|nr:NADP-dependent oxidoreductase domain-containing protein [Tuber borchii]
MAPSASTTPPPSVSPQPPTLTLPTTGSQHPLFLYGTAWKSTSTTDLVSTALSAGFRGLDTANQPKHYREDLIRPALALFSRNSLFIQTKFSSPAGQDPETIPYDPAAPLQKQVRASVERSLENLGVECLDALLLHSPLRTLEATISAWKVLEGFVAAGKIKHIGISNCSLPILAALYSSPVISVPPSIVQNRFYEDTGYDLSLLDFCREHGIVYQSFWTLTANPGVVKSEIVRKVAAERGWTREQAMYALVLALGRGWEVGGGVCVLNGTTNEERMKADLEIVGEIDGIKEDDVSEFRDLLKTAYR